MTREKAKTAANFLQSKTKVSPSLGIVLGTGLNKLVDHIEVDQSIPYSEIPGFVESSVAFHSGSLVFGHINQKPIVVMQGRFHLYEGYTYEQITFPIRVMHELGIQALLVSNAAGSMNQSNKKGDILLIEDHIHLQPGSPLANKAAADWGNKFVDLAKPYDEKLNNHMLESAKALNINLKKGVYVSVTGPQLETRAEYRFLIAAGADAVGMSTTAEVIVANQMNLPTVALSVLTDDCDPENLKPVNIPEILRTAAQAEQKLVPLVLNIIKKTP